MIIEKIVDELPENCRMCWFCCRLSKHCHALGEVAISGTNKKLKNCPLQLKRTCGSCSHFKRGLICERHIENPCMTTSDGFCDEWGNES